MEKQRPPAVSGSCGKDEAIKSYTEVKKKRKRLPPTCDSLV